MATIYKLDIETQKLQDDIERLRESLSGMRRTGDEMMAGINALSGMWEGEAKNAFTVQFQTDYENLKAMADVIDDLIKKMEQARQKYDTCEEKVGSIVNAIRV